MTRRITWIILLTVWAILIAAGVTAYLTTRRQMLNHLHHVMLDELMRGKEIPFRGKVYRTIGHVHAGDTQQTIAGSTKAQPHAQIIRATWVRLPGEPIRERSIVARVWAVPVDGESERVQLTVPYRRPAYEFDPLMNQVAVALIIATASGGVIAAFLARLTAKTSLRPLRSTAEVIGTIDDRSLDRRIDASRLPPELVPMAQRLNEMLQRLETAMTQRRQFLADASHELRTPVAALVAALELSLRRRRDIESYRQTIETCLADAQHLRRLVEALMTQVRSEAPVPDESEAVDLAALINDCVMIVSPLAEARDIRIKQSVEDLPSVRCPPHRFRSVLLNLISNAVEHNRPKGTVDVIAQHTDSSIEVHIRDTGPGIAAEHLPQLFEPFYRVDGARHTTEHLGLGLFLVKSHMRAMGGDCTVQSQVGVGTTFRVQLPLSAAKPAKTDVSQLQPQTASPTGERQASSSSHVPEVRS